MRLHYLAGDRTGALRQYEHCATALKEELGVKPSRRTVALYEQIRSDEFQGNLRSALNSKSEEANRELTMVDVGSGVVPKVFEHLRQLRQVLKELHKQIQQDIEKVEGALNGRR